MAKNTKVQLPVTLRLGAPTNLRPAGAHKQAKRQSRAAQKIALRKEID